MLLPSALTCDSSSSSSLPKPYYQSTPLFASPPISPPPSQLPSPPTQHMSPPIISSPFKLRLRNPGKHENSTLTPRKKITKRTASSGVVAPPRGVNKRRREVEDEMARENVDSEDEEDDEALEGKENVSVSSLSVNGVGGEREGEGKGKEEGPRTPKRLRLAPEVLPLGLERSDFHALHLQHQLSSQPLIFPSSSSSSTQGQSQNQEEEEWTSEDDRILVELVLEKLKLSKSEWQDCARSLGKDRGSVGRRWKSLMAVGEVGLKGRSRGRRMERRGIYGSWR